MAFGSCPAIRIIKIGIEFGVGAKKDGAAVERSASEDDSTQLPFAPTPTHPFAVESREN